MTTLARFISTVGYIGKFPFAPGTIGSFVAIFVWYTLKPKISTEIFIFFIFILFFIGLFSSSITEKELSINDPGQIVIDEWVGQWIALISIDVSLFWCFLSFVLFRVFDILKPYPINKIESYGGGLGIMADDVAAGFYTLLVLHILQFFIK